VRGAHGLVLIDWQCPGAGDPAEDVTCFLSPAMMTLYEVRPHSPAARARFLDTYADADVVERYTRDGAAWHYRIGAYCVWRAHRLARSRPDVGDRYRRALAAEMELIGSWT
jgi:thiamine kinase-like enzyme